MCATGRGALAASIKPSPDGGWRPVKKKDERRLKSSASEHAAKSRLSFASEKAKEEAKSSVRQQGGAHLPHWAREGEASLACQKLKERF